MSPVVSPQVDGNAQSVHGKAKMKGLRHRIKQREEQERAQRHQQHGLTSVEVAQSVAEERRQALLDFAGSRQGCGTVRDEEDSWLDSHCKEHDFSTK